MYLPSFLPWLQSMVGKANVCQGCPGRELCLSMAGRVDPDQKFINVRMNAVKRKILILSGKGGVGKSSVACSLAMALARRSRKVSPICNTCSKDYKWM